MSIEVQAEKCTELCALRGIAANKIYSDCGYTGANLDRPSMNELITAIQTSPPSYLVVFRLDRLSRNVVELNGLVDSLNAKGVQLISVSENLDTSTTSGRMMMSMILVMNQFERETIVARVKESLGYRKRQGQRYTGIIPYGKRLLCNRYEDSPEELETIRKIQEQRASGASLQKITDFLNRNSIPTRKGKPWGRSTVAIICNRRLNTPMA